MSVSEAFLAALERDGWAVTDELFPATLARSLLQEGEGRWQAGAFDAAHIGREAQRSRQAEIRGDTISWLEPDDAAPAVREFLAWTDTFRQELNQYFFLGLRRLEAHFARYEPGAAYARHMDQHRGMPHRKISMILYLNPNWKESDGGALRIYDPEQEDRSWRVLPLFGRLAVFRSDLVPHEVEPGLRTRWSVTGWFRTDDDTGLP